MSAPHVLILGGHGKVALKLTPLLLQKSWRVTSVIRNKDHESDITATAKSHPENLKVLVESIEDVRSTNDATRVLNQVRPDYVVWSAGAAGKGGPVRTFAIDRDACRYYIDAAASPSSSVKKFLLVSYIASRRSYPPWWTSEDKSSADNVNQNILANYFKAKVAADEYLLARSKAARDGGKEAFADICLRPGTLTDDDGGEGVLLGKTGSRGEVSRTDVARVAAALLDTEYRGWLDLLKGKEEVQEAVNRCVSEKVDCIEGEDLDAIYKTKLELD
ncbi:hypothetical protein TWF225_001492 [Orbilia oligospora]|uniref:Uncharacterized protein n=1 Tax=Orbilia oligospora TaxID=2813651 RepID=A0A7C8PUU5_ORBOL|nr:hypothetical protein TWF751_010882 [Orbilia oligospora]KAF3191354.1 hypothetical protein TWF225_001492 [Orbilia oligospora]KAF3267820.1 hypothetical protein TWF217_011552 [Orbilia oligospora]KAF3269540.1 hypothetical protein TWF128_005749 [Orbilia oligospora]KAF3296564.1 hypothetical protein TWF132_010155 [Orbilia oligospora]